MIEFNTEVINEIKADIQDALDEIAELKKTISELEKELFIAEQKQECNHNWVESELADYECTKCGSYGDEV